METDDTPFKVLGCFWMLNTADTSNVEWLLFNLQTADLPTEDM